MGWYIALALLGIVSAALLSAYGRRLEAVLAALGALAALGLFLFVQHGPSEALRAAALSPVAQNADVVGTRDCWVLAGRGWRGCRRQVSFSACSALVRSGRCAVRGR